MLGITWQAVKVSDQLVNINEYLAAKELEQTKYLYEYRTFWILFDKWASCSQQPYMVIINVVFATFVTLCK